MNRTSRLTVALAGLIAIATASEARAQSAGVESGNYTTADGRYTVFVEQVGNALQVREPNATSLYQSIGGGVYHYTHTNGVTYAIRVAGPGQLETFKPGVNGPGTSTPGTQLRLSPAAPAATEYNDEFEHLFEKYQQLIETDPANTHVWAACGAAALGRINFNQEGFAEYARQIVASIKPIMETPTRNPCADVIPNQIWNAG